jgi:hypothetical protein
MSKAILNSKVHGLFNSLTTPNVAVPTKLESDLVLARKVKGEKCGPSVKRFIFYATIVIPQGYNVSFFYKT